MNLPFVLRHALRESRASWKRLGLYMGSITLGVAALVAINSFRTNAVHSVEREARGLLGADLRVWSNRPFPQPVEAVLDSAKQNYDVARVTTLVSMAVAVKSGDTRLVQLRALERGYPFYTEIKTEPRGVWDDIQRGGRAVIDPSLLTQLGLRVGDTISLGMSRFAISGTVTKGPADFSFRSVIGPRVFIASADLSKTGLLQFGSLAQYLAYMRMPDKEVLRYVDQRRAFFDSRQVGFQTAEDQGENVTEALGTLSRFLGLVGLAALLLGGIGVASAVHVFVKHKRPVIAVLRCLGARERTVFAAYLLQAAALSLFGALLGVILGFGVQAILPRVMATMVPFDVPFAIDWVSVGAGLGVGLLVAVLFAIVPLLSIRGVSPLQAFRVEYDAPERRIDPYRIAALVLLIVGITALSVWQADNLMAGYAFASGLAGTLLILLLIALLLTRLTRHLLPRRASFTIRQGIANLYRPHNQTVSVTLSLGFGVFVIATMLTVQANLLGWLDIEHRATAPNVLAFDIQKDQRADIEAIFASRNVLSPAFAPIVPAKISAMNGKTVDYLMSHSEARKIASWALRREYRNTYRDTMVASEKLTAGRWFDKTPKTSGVSPVSIEEGVAKDLNLRLGDRVTWDFQGTPVETQIASIRKVDWAEFNTNFFVVFPSGVLEKAPQTYVGLGRLSDGKGRAALQRDLVAVHPNVSVIDLASVREALDEMMSNVALAIRFMALFSIIAGVIVLIGAVATSRFQRLRESALLKTIGGTRRQIMQILVTEYAALGSLAGATGVLLGGVASGLLMKYFFKLEYHVPYGALILLWFGVVVLAVVIGLLNSRDVFTRAPLAVLREISE